MLMLPVPYLLGFYLLLGGVVRAVQQALVVLFGLENGVYGRKGAIIIIIRHCQPSLACVLCRRISLSLSLSLCWKRRSQRHKAPKGAITNCLWSAGAHTYTHTLLLISVLPL